MPSLKSRAKTAAPYVLGAVRLSVQTLHSLSYGIPVPWIQMAIGAACQVIDTAGAVESNNESRQILIDRVYALMLVTVVPLKEKTEAEIPKDLKVNMERLTRDLTDIADVLLKLNKKAKSGRLRAFLSSVLLVKRIRGQIQDCTDKLDWALSIFQVETRINDSLRIFSALDDVREDMLRVHTSAEDIESGVRIIQEGTRGIQDALKARLGNSQIAPTLLSTIPPKPANLVGRDQDAHQIVNRILTTSSPRFVIRGAGGIGKTSVALAVFEHPDVVQRFDSRRHWVQCEQATSAGLFIELLAQALQVKCVSVDRLRDIIMMALHNDSQPRLLILDNFETPWEIHTKQSDILDILAILSQFPHLSLLLTLRGILPGPHRISWSQPELLPLSPLSMDASRNLYVDNHPEAKEDEQLDELLRELGGMPLVIQLISERGRSGETPSRLLELWRENGPDLGDGAQADRRVSVNKSIELSLQSALMKGCPDVITLLSVLAFLPGGVQAALIGSLVPSISASTLSKARSALLRTSLIHSSPDNSVYFVLSPIRSYMTHRHKLTSELWGDVFNYYVNFLEQQMSAPEKSGYLQNLKIIAKEEVNLEAVLLQALEPNGAPCPLTTVIQASLQFSLYQCHTRARSEVAAAAVRAASNHESTILLPTTLHRLGELDRLQCKFNEARHSAQQARHKFEQLGDRVGATRCLKTLGEIQRMQDEYVNARDSLQQARDEFEQLGDRVGAAQCLQSLGDIQRMQSKYDEARDSLHQARDEFERLGNRMDAAQCLQSLGNIHCVQSRDDEARDLLQQARDEFEQLGNQHGVAQCLRSLGGVQLMKHRYDEARDLLQQARDEFERLGNRLDMAQCLQYLGDIHRMQDKHDTARSLYQQARDEFERLQSRLGMAHCLRGLGDTQRMQHNYDGACDSLQRARHEFEQLGERMGATLCLQSLGDLQRMQHRYDEARDLLEQARDEFERLGCQRSVAQCLQSLGDLQLMQHKYDEARELLQRVREKFEQLGFHRGVAECLQSLGKIQYMQHEFDDACDLLEAARDSFEWLGERDRSAAAAAAECIELLNNIQRMQSKGDEAHALGIIQHMQHKSEKACDLLGPAPDGFERLGEGDGPECLQLGTIERKQNSSEQHRNFLGILWWRQLRATPRPKPSSSTGPSRCTKREDVDDMKGGKNHSKKWYSWRWWIDCIKRKCRPATRGEDGDTEKSGRSADSGFESEKDGLGSFF